MNSTTDPIIIIGAGMSGLACATWLHRAGRPVLVLEAADGVGGRVRTDVTPDGFRLDPHPAIRSQAGAAQKPSRSFKSRLVTG